MFHMHSERPDSPLNQEQAEALNAFCVALKEYRVDDASRFYYADLEQFGDREMLEKLLVNLPVERLIVNLKETLNTIEEPSLQIIERLEKTHPLKLQFQESLMVWAKVFFQLRSEKKWAMTYQDILMSEAQKENINKENDEWMLEQIARYFSNVQAFTSEFLPDIAHIKNFTRQIRDFFPTPDDYDKLFLMLRYDWSESFWNKHGDDLEESLQNLLISAFMVQDSPVPVPPLPSMVPAPAESLENPETGAAEVLMTPPQRPRVSVLPPRLPNRCAVHNQVAERLGSHQHKGPGDGDCGVTAFGITREDACAAEPGVGAASKGYSIIRVPADGDCGYTAFGITREQAYVFLKENLDQARDMLQLAVEEWVLRCEFYGYLVSRKVISGSLEDFIANSHRYANDLAIIDAFIDFDVRDKRIEAGWAHPAVLQLLATIRGINLYIWQLGDEEKLIPHHQYAQHIVSQTSERKDLLFINGNHFDQLAFSGGTPEVDDRILYPLNAALPERLVQPLPEFDPSALPERLVQPLPEFDPSALPEPFVQPLLEFDPSVLPEPFVQPLLEFDPSDPRRWPRAPAAVKGSLEKPETGAGRWNQEIFMSPVFASALPEKERPFWAYAPGTRPRPRVLVPDSPKQPETGTDAGNQRLSSQTPAANAGALMTPPQRQRVLGEPPGPRNKRARGFR